MADPERRRGDRRALHTPAALLAALLFTTYAYFLPAPAWNDTSRFGLVRALVERQRLDIDPYHHETGDKARYRGRYFSDKAPGAALLAAPAYGAYHLWLRVTGRPRPASIPLDAAAADDGPRVLVSPAYRRALYVCNLATNALAGAALGATFFLVLASIGVAGRLALLSTLSLSVGSLVFPYATMFYGHVLAAALLFGALALLRPRGAHAGDLDGAPRRCAWRPIAAGGLAGTAVLTELPTALGVAALAGYLWAAVPAGERLRHLGLFASGLAPPLGLLAGYQSLAFGSPLRAGYAFVENAVFAEGMSAGLLGITWPRPSALFGSLLGRTRGLLYVAPVLVLGLVGCARALRLPALRREARLAVVVVIAFVLLSASYYMWWGGAAVGPRHLIPALPFLCLGIPFALPPGGRWTALLLTLLCVSATNQLAVTAVSPLAPFGPDVLLEHAYPRLLRGEIPAATGSANLGRLLGLPGLASLLPLLGVWVLALRAILAALPPEPGGPAARGAG